MYFIIVRGESVPTNKIVHSDAVALNTVEDYIKIFSFAMQNP